MTSLSLPLPVTELPIVDGSYRTTPRRVSWLARWLPSFVFYWRMFSIVVRASIKAKRGNYDGQAWAESSLEVLRALESVGVEVEISGVEHLQNVDGPCLIVGNHMSTLETMVLPCIIQPIKHVTFVVKHQLVEYPIFKHVMRSRDPIAVSQSDPRGDFKLMMTGGQERLANGISVIVFPEGERTGKFEPKSFNSIGVKLANRASVPIVPVALLTDAWGMGPIISDFGKIDPTKKVYFRFAPPISVSGRGAEENAEIIAFIEENLQNWTSAKA